MTMSRRTRIFSNEVRFEVTLLLVIFVDRRDRKPVSREGDSCC
jgi:hypothetical protein